MITIVFFFLSIVHTEPVINITAEPIEPPYVEQWVTVTYYTASDDECGKTDGITASGAKAVEGVTVAADHLKFGTKVKIDGKTYVVQDRFGGGYSDKIDVYTESRSHAFQQGRQRKLVRIYNDDL